MDRTWKYEIYDVISLTTQGSLQMHNSDWWFFGVFVVEYRLSLYFFQDRLIILSSRTECSNDSELVRKFIYHVCM